MRRIMIDIETMSTQLDALILSVGACEFKLTDKQPVIYTPLTWVLDPREQLLTRRVSENTQEFWRRADPNAIHAWMHVPTTPLSEFMNGFAQYMRGDDVEVWANGIVFDFGNLTSLYQQHGYLDAPWKYNAARDARTIYKLHPKVRQRPDSFVGIEHDAASDCIHQVWGLWEYWPGKLPDEPEA